MAIILWKIEIWWKIADTSFKFVRCNLRQNIFKNKKLLKGKGVSITESLAKDGMAKLNEARET